MNAVYSRLTILALLLCSVVGLQAETYTKTYIVGPGHNGTHWIQSNTKVGDILIVNFEPEECYEMVSCDVDDGAKLGWMPNGPCSFKLTVTDEMEKEKTLKTRFYGQLKRTGCDDSGSEGSDEEELYDWDLTGLFSVYGECEGADHDNGRSPPAGLVSGGKTGDLKREGEAEFAQEGDDYWFNGTFDGYIGIYNWDSMFVEAPADSPIQLGDAEEKPCPDNDDVTVTYVYFGCDDSGGIGAKISRDLITINIYTPAVETDALRNALLAAKQALAEAQAAEEQAKQAAAAAAAEAEQKQKEYEEKLDEDPSIAAARRRLAKAKARLDAAQSELKAAQKTLESRERIVEDHKANKDDFIKEKSEQLYNVFLQNYERNVELAKENVAKKQAEVDKQQSKVNEAEADLQRAIDSADEAIKGARDAAAAAAAAAKEAQETYAAAQQATKEAEQAVAEAEAALNEALDKLEFEERDLLEKWQVIYAGTLEHELGHRRIAYFYLDKITDYLNTFRAWGWAPEEERAAALGQAHFHAVLNAYIKSTVDEHDAFQDTYDSPGGSNHGVDQDQWDWGRLQ